MPLRVQIDHENFLLKKIQTCRKIDAGRGLPATAFLVRNGDDSQKVRLPELKIAGVNVTASLSKAL